MRVIAGSARGRPLRAPTGDIRPTSDKVKGAIFSMLEAEAMRRGFEPSEDDAGDTIFAAALAWPTWLDLYAGSGALGIEALSRGARAVDFVDRAAEARAAIMQNLERTNLASRGRVLNARAERLFATPDRGYDVVLLDPPYDESEPGEILERLAESSLIHAGGVVMLEHARDRVSPERVGALRRTRFRVHGRTAIALYEESREG